MYILCSFIEGGLWLITINKKNLVSYSHAVFFSSKLAAYKGPVALNHVLVSHFPFPFQENEVMFRRCPGAGLLPGHCQADALWDSAGT